MKRRRIVACMMGAILCFLCSGCGTEERAPLTVPLESIQEAEEDAQGTVTLTVWGAEEDQALLQSMVDRFQQTYQGEAQFSITIAAESEASCKETVLGNVTECPDVFAFVDDQLTAFAAAGVIKPIENAEDVKSKSLEGAVNAASINGKLYAYPMTADNGYFMFYNKKYFKDEDLKSLDRMLEIAQANEKKVTMDWNSGWYLYSFFAHTGLKVGINEDGITNFCTWNATDGKCKGVDVANSMLKIGKHKGFLHGNDGALTAGAKDGTVIAGISGVWLADSLKAAWGEDYAATKLPSYSCAGEQIQMGSFTGYKMLGVNANSKHKEWATKLAEWITNEENQMLRFQQRGQGPANKKAAENQEVKDNVAIKALIEQSEYGSLQRIGGKYWDPVAKFGVQMAEGKNAGHLQETLDDLVKAVTGM